MKLSDGLKVKRSWGCSSLLKLICDSAHAQEEQSTFIQHMLADARLEWTRNNPFTKQQCGRLLKAVCLCRYRMPSQQHFYMEPQAAVAQPDEAGTMTVHCASQSLDTVQSSVAVALGVSMSSITAGDA